MNAFRKTLIAAAVLSAFAAAVRADDITPDPYRDMVTTFTRAQVVAERDAARAAGELGALDGEDGGSFHLARIEAPSQLAREQVRAEVLAARADGSLDTMTGEDSGSFALARARVGEPVAHEIVARSAD